MWQPCAWRSIGIADVTVGDSEEVALIAGAAPHEEASSNSVEDIADPNVGTDDDATANDLGFQVGPSSPGVGLATPLTSIGG